MAQHIWLFNRIRGQLKAILSRMLHRRIAFLGVLNYFYFMVLTKSIVKVGAGIRIKIFNFSSFELDT